MRQSPNTLRPGPLAAALCEHFEGFRSSPYLDPAGVWTVGYGHTLPGGPSAAFRNVSESFARELMLDDLLIAAQGVRSLVKVPLSGAEFDALCSFTFNLGAARLRDSTLLARLNAGEYSAVPAELARWNKARVNGTLTTLRGLTRRRAAEAAVWSGSRTGIPLVDSSLAGYLVASSDGAAPVDFSPAGLADSLGIPQRAPKTFGAFASLTFGAVLLLTLTAGRRVAEAGYDFLDR